MRIILILFLLLPLSTMASAQLENYAPPQHLQDFHFPDSYVKVVPSSEINVPEEFKAEQELISKQRKEKGYSSINTEGAASLLALKYKSKSGVKRNQNNSDTTDTSMRENISDIKLAFFYKGIPFVDADKVIGFSPMGGWIDSAGWSGVTEFFNDKDLGVCSFVLSNIALTHGYVILSADQVKYAVMGKPTTTFIDGSPSIGFIYNVSWYDKIFSHELECANTVFSKDIIRKMIILSNQIDKYTPAH